MGTPTKYIGKLQIDNGSPILIGSTMYGICTTAANTAAKVIGTAANNSGKFINNNFDADLQGITIHIKFTQGNTVTSGMTLLIGEQTTAHAVVGRCVCDAGTIISFTYDENQQWVVNDNVDTNTEYVFKTAYNASTNKALTEADIGNAAVKGVVTDIGANTGSNDLPTAAAVVSYVVAQTGGLQGLTGAMHFRGTATVAIADGDDSTHDPTISGYTFNGNGDNAGDVVLYNGKEFVWTGTTWEELGDEGSWALDNAVIHNSLLVAAGDMIYATGAGVPGCLSGNSTGTKKFLSMTNSAPSWVSLVAADVGLSNVTNHAQVTSLQWAYEDKKLTYKVSEGSAIDLLTFAQGSNITLTGAAGTLTIAASDSKVTQNILTTAATDNYPLLVSYYKTNEATTTAQTVNRIAAIYVQPSTGTLFATKFSGDGSALTNLSATAVLNALDYLASANTTTFLHKSGVWKTLDIDVTADNSGDVLTDVTLTSGTLPSFTEGTLATAEVDSGVLIITSATASTFSAGTHPAIDTKSKANLEISMT